MSHRLNEIYKEMANLPKEYSGSGHRRADELLVETVGILTRPLDITQARARKHCANILLAYAELKKLYGEY